MRFLFIDDHHLFLDGMGFILSGYGDGTEIITAENGQQALEQLNQDSNIDLILFDINMPKLNGLGLLKELKAKNLWIPCVAVSAEEDPLIIKELIDEGALGFIPKSYTAEEMLNAVREICLGNSYLPKSLQKELSYIEENQHLSNRQIEVLKLLAKGLSNKEIAHQLCVSEYTVKSHLLNIFRALNVKNRTECVHEAKRLNVIPQNF